MNPCSKCNMSPAVTRQPQLFAAPDTVAIQCLHCGQTTVGIGIHAAQTEWNTNNPKQTELERYMERLAHEIGIADVARANDWGHGFAAGLKYAYKLAGDMRRSEK